jgi:transcriptional regulator with XRE-family HTH domain
MPGEGIMIQRAARLLRAYLHLSQQAMATALGLSMGALRNYESGAVTAPNARAATAYMMAAARAGRPDLAEVFRDALHRSCGLATVADQRAFAGLAGGRGRKRK